MQHACISVRSYIVHWDSICVLFECCCCCGRNLRLGAAAVEAPVAACQGPPVGAYEVLWEAHGGAELLLGRERGRGRGRRGGAAQEAVASFRGRDEDLSVAADMVLGETRPQAGPGRWQRVCERGGGHGEHDCCEDCLGEHGDIWYGLRCKRFEGLYRTSLTRSDLGWVTVDAETGWAHLLLDARVRWVSTAVVEALIYGDQAIREIRESSNKGMFLATESPAE